MTLLEVALSQYGVREIPGKQDNPAILKYFHETGFKGSQWKDETAWCSAFMNWCAMKAGLECSGALNARSWLQAGLDVNPVIDGFNDPAPGDIVVFWRESIDSWKGHVGIYISQNERSIYVLGGNQANMVCVKPYPKSRVLGYRILRPKGGGV